jgi:GDP-4-dehydro-6-deoxy-D-mannose reductase
MARQRPADDVVCVLITGAGGFVGRKLVAALAARHPDWIIDAPCGAFGDPEAHIIDVTDETRVTAWIAERRPDVVVHLAAVAAVTASVKDPRLAWRVNLDGTLNLVLAMQAHSPNAHLLFVSSAEVYGQSLKSATQVDETALLQPVNPYAASKAAADILVRQAAASGLSATVVRPFNHTGQGQSEAFVVPSFAAQIARIEAGLQPPTLLVGNLDDERDFLDVSDVIDAYDLLLTLRSFAEARGAFNVSSGVAIRIGDLLEKLLSLANVRIEVRIDSERLRPAPIPKVVGDSTRLRQLGWAPRASLDDTLAAVLDEQRRAIVN